MSKQNKLKILLTGDLCPITTAEEKLVNGQEKSLFGTMWDELQDKDLLITNLECAVTKGGESIEKMLNGQNVAPLDFLSGQMPEKMRQLEHMTK